MPGYNTGKDLLIDVLSRAEELGLALGDREAEAKRYIQASYISTLAEGFPWIFGRKKPPGVLTTVAEITAGTVNVTKGSASITFSSAPAASVKDSKFYTEDDGIVYRISAHTAGAAGATLDSTYLGSTNTAVAYHVFQDEYDLATDFLVPLGKRFMRDMQGRFATDLISEDEFSTRYSYPARRSGPPRYVTFVADKRVRFGPYATDARRYEYGYIYHPGTLPFDGSAADTLIIQPAEHRIVVALFAIGNMLLDKDDDRAQAYFTGGESVRSQMKRTAIKQVKPRLWLRPQYRISTPR